MTHHPLTVEMPLTRTYMLPMWRRNIPTSTGHAMFLKTVLVLSVASLLILLAVARLATAPLPEVGMSAEAPVTLSDQQIDFGLIPLYGSAIREFLLRNDGVEPLHARLTVNGPDFSVTPQELLIPPGLESRVSVAMTADRPGSYDDELKIHFVGDDVEPLIIRLAGEAEYDSSTIGRDRLHV